MPNPVSRFTSRLPESLPGASLEGFLRDPVAAASVLCELSISGEIGSDDELLSQGQEQRLERPMNASDRHVFRKPGIVPRHIINRKAYAESWVHRELLQIILDLSHPASDNFTCPLCSTAKDWKKLQIDEQLQRLPAQAYDLELAPFRKQSLM